MPNANSVENYAINYLVTEDHLIDHNLATEAANVVIVTNLDHCTISEQSDIVVINEDLDDDTYSFVDLNKQRSMINGPVLPPDSEGNVEDLYPSFAYPQYNYHQNDPYTRVERSDCMTKRHWDPSSGDQDRIIEDYWCDLVGEIHTTEAINANQGSVTSRY